MEQKDLNYEELEKKAFEQLRSGKPLFGKDGAFAPLLKDFLEEVLQAEMASSDPSIVKIIFRVDEIQGSYLFICSFGLARNALTLKV